MQVGHAPCRVIPDRVQKHTARRHVGYEGLDEEPGCIASPHTAQQVWRLFRDRTLRAPCAGPYTAMGIRPPNGGRWVACRVSGSCGWETSWSDNASSRRSWEKDRLKVGLSSVLRRAIVPLGEPPTRRSTLRDGYAGKSNKSRARGARHSRVPHENAF